MRVLLPNSFKNRKSAVRSDNILIIYIFIYIYIYIYTYIYINIYKYTYICIYTSLYMYIPCLDPRRAFRAVTFGCVCRFRGSATFSLLRTNICTQQFSRCCCWSRRAPSCIFRVADRTMEANAMRLCRRLCPAACFSCLLRLLTLENDELPRK